jgi:predicted GNAT family acetyltransferase
MRAKEWAVLLRIDVATFSRWENDDQNIGSQSDALIRYVYCRLSAEREGRRVSEPIVNLIASVSQRDEVPAIVIDRSNVEIYKYRSMSELLGVTDEGEATAAKAVIQPATVHSTSKKRERGVALPPVTDDPQLEGEGVNNYV